MHQEDRTRAALGEAWSRAWWLVPLVLVAGAYRDSWRFGFVADAIFLIQENRHLDDLGRFWDTLVHDYFWSSSGSSIPYWRPFTNASWLLEAKVFRGWAGGHHLVSVAWLLFGVGMLELLARRLGAARMLAMSAGLLFGLHPAAIEPTCFIMARSDVVAASSSVGALAAWWSWRRGDGPRWLVAHAVFMAIALASKETALVLPVVLTLWTCLDRTRGLRWRCLLPAWVLGFLYLVGRALVLAEHPRTVVTVDPLRIFVSIGRYLEALIPFQVESRLHAISYEEAATSASLAAASAAWGILLATAAWAWRRRNVPVIVFLAWLGASLAPVLIVDDMRVPNPAGKLPLADRWAMQAIAAAALVLVVGVSRLGSARVTGILAGAIGIWAVGAVVVSSRTHASFADNIGVLDLEDRWFRETPSAFVTKHDECRFRERQVVRAVARGQSDEALAHGAQLGGCAPSPAVNLNLLSAMVSAERFAEARELLASFTSGAPIEASALGRLNYLAGITLVETGEAREGEAMLIQAQRRGLATCAMFYYLARAAAAQGHYATAAARLDEAAACMRASGMPVPRALLETAARYRHRAGTVSTSSGSERGSGTPTAEQHGARVR